jgi:hypothetical protein
MRPVLSHSAPNRLPPQHLAQTSIREDGRRVTVFAARIDPRIDGAPDHEHQALPMSPRPTRGTDVQQRDPVVTIGEPVLRVLPGQMAHTTLTVTNVVDQVEGYSIDVCKGPARHWSEVTPRHVELLPGQQADVAVTFRPPAGPRPPAGAFPIGLQVVSTVDESRRAVVECDVTVEAVHGLQARLLPVTGRGSHRGRYRIDLENVGTAPVVIALTPQQPGDTALSFALQPAQLAIPPGGIASSYLLVRPVRPTLFGRPETLSLSVDYAPAESPGAPARPDTSSPDGRSAGPPSAPPAHPDAAMTGRIDGSFLRRPVLPRGVVALVLVLAVLAVAGVVAGRLLIPRPEPAALEQVVPPAPTLIAVQQTPDGVEVTWQAVPTAASYAVERVATATSTGATEQEKVEGGVVSKLFPNPKPGQYCYRVVAVNDVGDSRASAVQCVTAVAEPAPVAQEVSGAFVIYGQPIATTDPDAYLRTTQLIQSLTTRGLQAKLVDTGDVPIPGVLNAYVVLQDGFSGVEPAQQYCAGAVHAVAPEVVCTANNPVG